MLQYLAMLNKKVLMSGAQFFANDAHINPYYRVENINSDKAQAEHDRIRQAFEQAGMTVVKVDPPSDSQDGVYVANWAVIHGGKAVMSRLPDARKAEEPYAKKILSDMGLETITVPEDWHFSGQGDALPFGKYLLAGSGYRSDPRAQQFVADTLGLELVQLHANPELDAAGRPVVNSVSGWADSFFYDIDIAVAVLDEDLIAYCPEALDAASNQTLQQLPVRKILVDYEEATKGLACNLVSTGQTVIMSARAPKLQAEIAKHGLETITPEISELIKGGGYIRCVSLTLD
jgi:N-dimethylarginine dimethylaminohydrolase